MLLSTSFCLYAVVPGLGLKMNEKEFMNFIYLTSSNVSSKSIFSSPG